MAKVSILGNAIVFTSTLKLEDIKTVKKFRPDALVLKDEEKEPVFAINTMDNPFGSLNKYGASFGAANADGFAIITMTTNDSEGVKEYVADEFGGPLTMLASLEESIPAVAREAAAQHAKVLESIETIA